MKIQFANIRLDEQPVLVLKNAGGKPMGVLGYAKNVSCDIKYNEVSSIEFEVPAYVDGVEVPYYDNIVGMRVVEVKGLGQFTLIRPTEEGEGVTRQKRCTGYSLEYEFAYKKITIPDGTYCFWDSGKPGETVLGMIMEKMPSWSIGSIDNALASKYRTFSVSNENLYNFMKGTCQESFNCLFDFDTMNRKVYVRDLKADAAEKPVYITNENIAKSFEVEEDTEAVVTRLDVSGAEGVDIRDVNPCGTNRIINLEYFMTTDNFDQALIQKYHAWKALCESKRKEYYNLSVQYALKVAQQTAENAKLTDLKGELTKLENVQAVTIQAIAQKAQTQSDLTAASQNVAAKTAEIDAKEAELETIESERKSLYQQMAGIQTTCSFEKYFTSEERKMLDRYIKDDSIQESSFVVSSAVNYDGEGRGSAFNGKQLTITGATIEQIATSAGTTLYDVKGGEAAFSVYGLSARVISATMEVKSNNKCVISLYLGRGILDDLDFAGACVSIMGTASSVSNAGGALSATINNGYCYFTKDASEYEKRSVAWELYEYGEEVLAKLAQPTYTFNITSANFFTLDEFETFRTHIELGSKVYVSTGDERVLKPIFIGARFTYERKEELELMFSDTYTGKDGVFKLVDLLNKSVSMGKSVDVSKYVYSAFVDTGASNTIRDFMKSSLDAAKNAIISSSEQAISWDGAGLRLRRWSNEEHTAYENEQIWMSNNSVVMTDDGWNTARLAIGKFYDENIGDCWGIVADQIVGTLIAGQSLVIESSKKSGETAVFRVDGDGCRLYNSDFSIIGDNRHIAINTHIGLAIGKYPLYSEANGVYTLNSQNANFWVDRNGNVNVRGKIVATELIISEDGESTGIDEYISNNDDVKNKNRTFHSSTAPANNSTNRLTVGDLWINTSQSNKIYRWNGYRWAAAYDTHLEYLIDRVDGKTTTFYGGATPEGYDTGDIWYDTYYGVIKRYNGTRWVDITDDALKKALDLAGTAKDVADGKIVTFAQGEEPTAKSIGDLWINTNNDNMMLRWDGESWEPVRDTWNDSLISYLLDEVDGKTASYFSSSAPSSPSKNDLWYDTDDGSIYQYRYDYTTQQYYWHSVTNDVLKKAFDRANAVLEVANNKIMTYAQNTDPKNDAGVVLHKGDLWIDTGDGNKFYRWDGLAWRLIGDFTAGENAKTYYTSTAPSSPVDGDVWYNWYDGKIKRYNSSKSGWEDITSAVLKQAIDKADAIYNGTTGIYFPLSDVSSLTMNKTVGLKIIGQNQSYFQVKNDAMGFFDKDGNAMLYYDGGNMNLKGTITALQGYIGGMQGWKISTKCIYSGTASSWGSSGGIYIGTDGISIGSYIKFDQSSFKLSTGSGGWTITGSSIYSSGASSLESPNGIYIGTDGISVRKAIVMKENGTFIIRRNNTDTGDGNYVMKVEPASVSGETGVYDYKMTLNDVELGGSFVVPVKNGGTGGRDRNSARNGIGIYNAASKNDIVNIEDAKNGDICLVYTNTMLGCAFTNTPTKMIFLSTKTFGTNATLVGTENNYYMYFNCRMTHNIYVNGKWVRDNNQREEYVRTGRTEYDDTNIYMYYRPVNITVPEGASGVTALYIKFTCNTKPSKSGTEIKRSCRDERYNEGSEIYLLKWKQGSIYISSVINHNYGYGDIDCIENGLYATSTYHTTSFYPEDSKRLTTTIGKCSYLLPEKYRKASDKDIAISTYIELEEPITSGEYYLLFTGTPSIWIKPSSITFNSTSDTNTKPSIHIMSNNTWKMLAEAAN